MTDDKKATDKSDIWAELRKPFPKEVVGKLPRGGITLDFVGHAAVTDRLLKVDPTWAWEPLSLDESGLPALDADENLWIKLTIAGVTRLGVGDGRNMKERIGDALRNAAMRFGVALDLWTKDELESTLEHPELKNRPASAASPPKSPQVVRAKIFAQLTRMGFDSQQCKQIVYAIADTDPDSTLTINQLQDILMEVEARSADELSGDYLAGNMEAA